ncbi:hypothetical protein, partial [Faecalicoccus acidiformans]|uniref:hypothetical protein n=1 Tax=Faecalicoccus acidiformans TaxID=915173 RepID=UPI001C862C29
VFKDLSRRFPRRAQLYYQILSPLSKKMCIFFRFFHPVFFLRNVNDYIAKIVFILQTIVIKTEKAQIIMTHASHLLNDHFFFFISSF